MTSPYHPAPPAPPASRKRLVWPWLLGAVLVLLVLVAVIGATARPGPTPAGGPVPPSYAPTPTPAAAPAAPTAAAGPATSIGDGTYQVGVDMAAGRYKTRGPATDAVIKDCYWARTKDDSGQFDAIISNGNATGPGSVTVKKGEFFQVSGGCTWIKQ